MTTIFLSFIITVVEIFFQKHGPWSSLGWETLLYTPSPSISLPIFSSIFNIVNITICMFLNSNACRSQFIKSEQIAC